MIQGGKIYEAKYFIITTKIGRHFLTKNSLTIDANRSLPQPNLLRTYKVFAKLKAPHNWFSVLLTVSLERGDDGIKPARDTGNVDCVFVYMLPVAIKDTWNLLQQSPFDFDQVDFCTKNLVSHISTAASAMTRGHCVFGKVHESTFLLHLRYQTGSVV